MTPEEKIATAPVIEDGEWFEPTENPFIHGCCDCGLAHRIEYLVDNGLLSLRFYRDLEATRMLQERLGFAAALSPEEERLWKQTKGERTTREDWLDLHASIVAYKRRCVARHLADTSPKEPRDAER